MAEVSRAPVHACAACPRVFDSAKDLAPAYVSSGPAPATPRQVQLCERCYTTVLGTGFSPSFRDAQKLAQ